MRERKTEGTLSVGKAIVMVGNEGRKKRKKKTNEPQLLMMLRCWIPNLYARCDESSRSIVSLIERIF